MTCSGKLTKTRYCVTNAILAAFFANALLFGPSLEMGKAFTSGFATGIGIAWLGFALVGWIALRRPGAVFDERSSAVFAQAAQVAYWVVMLALAVSVVLGRSGRLGLALDATKVAASIMNLGLAAYGISALVFWRKM